MVGELVVWVVCSENHFASLTIRFVAQGDNFERRSSKDGNAGYSGEVLHVTSWDVLTRLFAQCWV